MSCTLKEELLALHAGGDLPVAEAAEVEQHVLQCGNCAKELASYRSARESLMALRGESLAVEGLWAEIEARLDVVDATTRHQRPWYARYSFGAPLAAAAALVLAVQLMPEGGEQAPNGGADGEQIAQEDPVLQPASHDELADLFLHSTPAEVDPIQTDGLVSRPVSSEEF
jgi:anti-sigma factor RsiW